MDNEVNTCSCRTALPLSTNNKLSVFTGRPIGSLYMIAKKFCAVTKLATARTSIQKITAPVFLVLAININKVWTG